MSSKRPKSIQRVNNVAVILGLIFSILAIINVIALFNINHQSDKTHAHHYECVNASDSLMIASDYLTSEIRMYVMTGDRKYAENYLREVYADRRRDAALEVLTGDSKHQESLSALTEAFKESSELSETELYAMRLMADVTNMEHVPSAISSIELSSEDAALSNEEKQLRAQNLVLSETYQQSKENIISNVSDCRNRLIEELHQEEKEIETKRTTLLTLLTIGVLFLILLLVHVAYANYRLVVRPMRDHVKNIDEGKALSNSGAQEVRHMAESYNAMFAENHLKTERLEHEAHTDALTGLLNRGSYDHALEQNLADIALILIDVDNFKEINDTYGHAVGDEVLKRVAQCIDEQFRTSDYACRIGGDEFAIIMTKMRGVGTLIVMHKLAMIAAELGEEVEGIPVTTLSMGVAFSGDLEDGEDLYRAADQALYKAKEQGRDQVCFYNE